MLDLVFAGSGEFADRPALFDSDGSFLTYRELAARVGTEMPISSSKRKLAFLLADNTIAAATALLGLLSAHHAVALLNPDMGNEALARFAKIYEPDWLITPVDEHVRTLADTYDFVGAQKHLTWLAARKPSGAVLGDELAVMLTTSGSTGSPKLVRLSLENLRSNARAIADVLSISETDRAVGHLALHYSYGLSVLTSHITCGAAVAFNPHSFTSSAFWTLVRNTECTSLPGVPYHYEMLRRLDLDKLDGGCIKSCTQAGGRLSPAIVSLFARKLESRRGRFFLMYGQTEAAPRMTTLVDVLSKPESVGRALKGGRIAIVDAQGNELSAGQNGEVIYYGPNVMLGYAQSRQDLALGDIMKGALHTGDLGYLDVEGDLYITGRAARFAKVFGLRVSLDDVERECGAICAAVERAGKILVLAEDVDESECAAITKRLADHLKIHASAIKVRSTDRLPMKSNGKIDYQAISE